jgi:hypothetical protein
MAQNEEHPLKKWEDALKEAHIDFEKFEDHLYAKMDKRDEEGHHMMRLNIYYDESIGIYANFSALGEVIPAIEPSEAISKFREYKLTSFAD